MRGWFGPPADAATAVVCVGLLLSPCNRSTANKRAKHQADRPRLLRVVTELISDDPARPGSQCVSLHDCVGRTKKGRMPCYYLP
jgi:hypothetical protein